MIDHGEQVTSKSVHRNQSGELLYKGYFGRADVSYLIDISGFFTN